MNLDHLATYLEVIRSGSFHEAGKKLGISQPTVSQHIKKLEAGVGARLIVRQRTGCIPAPHTEKFIQYAEAMLRLSQKARQALRRPTMSVGAASNIGIYVLQPYFSQFQQSYGDQLDVDMVIDRNDVIAQRLENGELDIGAMEWWSRRKGFVAYPWRQEPLVVIVPPGHAWASRSEIGKADLVGQPLIGGEAHTGTGRILRKCLGGISSRLTVTMSLGSTEAVKNAVRSGLGISIVMAAAVAEEVADGRLVAVPVGDADIFKELYLIHRRNLPEDSFPMRFVETVLENGNFERVQ